MSGTVDMFVQGKVTQWLCAIACVSSQANHDGPLTNCVGHDDRKSDRSIQGHKEWTAHRLALHTILAVPMHSLDDNLPVHPWKRQGREGVGGADMGLTESWKVPSR